MSKNFQLSKDLLRHSILYDFRAGLKAAESHRRLCQAFGPDIVSATTVRDWFQRFKSGDYSIVDKTKSGRPPELDDGELRQLVESNPRLTTREMATTLGYDQSTIVDRLHKLGKVPKLGCWVPHELTENNRQQRFNICMSLLSYHRTTAWLDSVVTGDEKWVLYLNTTRKRQWIDKDAKPEPEPKPDLHQKKVMISVWWDLQGVVMLELLPDNMTINAAYYCDQLQRLSAELDRKRPRHGIVRLLHDNARPHTAKVTCQKLLELGWEVLPHPPYSPDLAPSDYHLFRALQNFLKEKMYKGRDQLKCDLDNFFDSQRAGFYRDCIHKLPQRWQRVIENNGGYVVD
jgi:histone-lysine N-methyltransferase SETMAR